MYSFVHTGIYLIMLAYVATGRHSSNFHTPSRKWITELFADAQRDFSMELAPSEKCKSDYRLYLTHLRNQSVWAVRMKESSEWPSVGLYSGMVDHLGNWAQCLRASGPDDIAGKYCIAEMKLKNFPADRFDPGRHLTTVGWECEDCSAWSMLRKCSDDPLRGDRRKIQWAVCLPSSCSAEDLQTSLESIVTPIFDSNDLSVEVKVDSSSCSTSASEHRKYPVKYYITRSIFLGLIILVAAVTIKDVFLKKHGDSNGRFEHMIACFSAKQSCKSLTETTEEIRNPIYFIKFLFTLFTAMAHRWIMSFYFPIFQAEEVERDYYSGKLFFLSQMNGVDVFFLISGFLLYRFSIRPMRKVGFPFVGIYAVFRLLKTLPVHGMTILFVANMLPHLGNGPFWNSSQAWMTRPCQEYWLYNMLAMNNFQDASDLCIVPTWHLAVDFQNSLIGILLLLVLTKNRTLGFILIGLAFTLSIIFASLIAYFFNISGFHVFSIGKLRNVESYLEVNKLYFKFYPRLSPFLLGMVLGITVERWQKKNHKLSQAVSWFIFLLSVATAILVQYHGFTLVCDRRYSILWKSIFSGLYRPLYTLPYAVLLFIYFTSGIGFLDFLFTRKIFFALGRLSLSFLFCSYVFQMYHLSIQRTAMPTSSALNIYMWSIADIIIALPVSFFCYLIIDGPFTNLIKLLNIELFKTARVRRWIEKDDAEMKMK